MKKITTLLLTLLLAFTLIACNKAPTNEESKETDKTYVLVENIINGQNKPILDGEYLYLTFKTNGTVENKQKSNGQEEKILTENYTKEDNCYIVQVGANNGAGLTLKVVYEIKDNGETLVSTQEHIFTIKQTFKLVK